MHKIQGLFIILIAFFITSCESIQQSRYSKQFSRQKHQIELREKENGWGYEIIYNGTEIYLDSLFENWQKAVHPDTILNYKGISVIPRRDSIYSFSEGFIKKDSLLTGVRILFANPQNLKWKDLKWDDMKTEWQDEDLSKLEIPDTIWPEWPDNSDVAVIKTESIYGTMYISCNTTMSDMFEDIFRYDSDEEKELYFQRYIMGPSNPDYKVKVYFRNKRIFMIDVVVKHDIVQMDDVIEIDE